MDQHCSAVIVAVHRYRRLNRIEETINGGITVTVGQDLSIFGKGIQHLAFYLLQGHRGITGIIGTLPLGCDKVRMAKPGRFALGRAIEGHLHARDAQAIVIGNTLVATARVIRCRYQVLEAVIHIQSDIYGQCSGVGLGLGG